MCGGTWKHFRILGQSRYTCSVGGPACSDFATSLIASPTRQNQRLSAIAFVLLSHAEGRIRWSEVCCGIMNDNNYFVVGKRQVWGGVQPFGISRDDLRRHVHISGQTGVGKSTLIRNLALQLI